MNILKMLMKRRIRGSKGICCIYNMYLNKCLSLITLLFYKNIDTDEYGLSTIYSSTAAILIILHRYNYCMQKYIIYCDDSIKYKEDRNGYSYHLFVRLLRYSLRYTLLYVIFLEHFESWGITESG